MQSCVLKVISVVFYCLFLNYSGMTMAKVIIHQFVKWLQTPSFLLELFKFSQEANIYYIIHVYLQVHRRLPGEGRPKALTRVCTPGSKLSITALTLLSSLSGALSPFSDSPPEVLITSNPPASPIKCGEKTGSWSSSWSSCQLSCSERAELDANNAQMTTRVFIFVKMEISEPRKIWNLQRIKT